MNLLFSINDKFVTQLATVLLSIKLNTKPQVVHVYVLQKKKLARTADLQRTCQRLGMHYHPVIVNDELFAQAPVTDRYPTTIYYRLLAHELLPQNLHKVLYLDADLLCINDLTSLYTIPLDDYLYASAIHTELTTTTDVINKIRLQNFDADGYYNSGVLLMNLDNVREQVRSADIFNYIRTHAHTLLLPDQDVLNALYGRYIKAVPDQLYNFDARKGRIYETISFGQWTTDWVMRNTVILHYCGRDKPWLPAKNTGRYTALYKNYFQLAKRLMQN